MIGGCGDGSLVAAAKMAIRLATAETAVCKAETTVSFGGCGDGGLESGDDSLLWRLRRRRSGKRRRQSPVAAFRQAETSVWLSGDDRVWWRVAGTNFFFCLFLVRRRRPFSGDADLRSRRSAETTVRLRRRHCAQTGSLGADFFQELRFFWFFCGVRG